MALVLNGGIVERFDMGGVVVVAGVVAGRCGADFDSDALDVRVRGGCKMEMGGWRWCCCCGGRMFGGRVRLGLRMRMWVSGGCVGVEAGM